MLFEQMNNESKRLETLIDTIQKNLSALPDGKLICCRNQSNHKWYYKPEHPSHITNVKNPGINSHITTLNPSEQTRIYIPKKNRSFAEKLALKKYLSYLLKESVTEKNAIDFYLRHHSQQSPKSAQLLTDFPGYRELLSPYFKPHSQELLAWMSEDFESNPQYPEKLIHKSISGNMLRSKSEVLIDMLLYMNQIPFRYECILQLGSITMYPDFTIRHPKTGDFYYWEHFGLMDDTSYQKKTAAKLETYITHGIIPSIHLITTYETKDVPLTTNSIETILHQYFLS